MDTFFNRALPYIEMGWKVFPTRPDKVPLCPHGRNDATCVATTIEDWSDSFPMANVSIQTGEESGIAVIDIDSEEGERHVAEWNKRWDRRLPETAEAKSGRGRHLYFSYMPVKSADGKLAPGIDLKCIGGSICAPISMHSTGKLYEWVKPPFGRHLPLLPMWIVRALAPPKRVRHHPYGPQNISEERIENLLVQITTCAPGQRNHTLNRVSFIMGLIVRDGGLGEREALEKLVAAGVASGLSKRESYQTVRSGLKSGLKTPIVRAV